MCLANLDGRRIMFSGQYQERGFDMMEWRERLGWFGEGNIKEIYFQYEAVGDPTEPEDAGGEPPPRFVWVYEIGMWQEKNEYYKQCKIGLSMRNVPAKLADGLYWNVGNAKQKGTAGSKQAATDIGPETTETPPAVNPLGRGGRRGGRGRGQSVAEPSTNTGAPETVQEENSRGRMGRGSGRGQAVAGESMGLSAEEPPTTNVQGREGKQGGGGKGKRKAKGIFDVTATEELAPKKGRKGGKVEGKEEELHVHSGSKEATKNSSKRYRYLAVGIME
ncbi:hypothetical protein VTO42DRAFT_8953 [Malbranchea cinnamomea]